MVFQYYLTAFDFIKIIHSKLQKLLIIMVVALKMLNIFIQKYKTKKRSLNFCIYYNNSKNSNYKYLLTL